MVNNAAVVVEQDRAGFDRSMTIDSLSQILFIFHNRTDDRFLWTRNEWLLRDELIYFH